VTNKARLGEEGGGEGDEVGAVHTAAGARRAGGGAAVPMALSGRGEERGWGGVGRRGGGGEREIGEGIRIRWLAFDWSGGPASTAKLAVEQNLSAKTSLPVGQRA
jgi:hypothetical protein